MLKENDKTKVNTARTISLTTNLSKNLIARTPV